MIFVTLFNVAFILLCLIFKNIVDTITADPLQPKETTDKRRKATQYTLTSNLTLGTPITVSNLLHFICICSNWLPYCHVFGFNK